ncbi:hypothetical protein HY632_01040, partial [Candidatus Uhrbacteria bacterium]|nr:hypothetical protein [Candidatus Uhrbacteria bacterium]
MTSLVDKIGIRRIRLPRPTAVRAVVLVLAAIVLGVVAGAPLPSFAGAMTQTIAEYLGIFLSVVISFLGKLLLLVIYVLTLVAQYNSFVTSPAVSNGWVIVRDIANMFFIIALLVIAFGTILSIKEYQVQSLLPKLVFGAIFINFSKTIAGIFIDLSQVAMMTFVNGFAAAAAGNFAQAFQIQQIVTITPMETAGTDILQVVMGYLLAFVLLAIALATCVVMTVILAYRVVMLWALVVLSPLPYLLNAIPQGKKYANEWWSEFGKYLTTGPVLAFFLWLALVTAGSGNVGTEFTGGDKVGGSEIARKEYSGGSAALGSVAGEPESLISFVIAISMLIAGLQIGAKTGAMGSKMLGNIVDKTKEYGTKTAKRVTGYRHAEEVMKIRKQRSEEKFKESAAKWSGRVDLAAGTLKGGAALATAGVAAGARGVAGGAWRKFAGTGAGGSVASAAGAVGGVAGWVAGRPEAARKALQAKAEQARKNIETREAAGNRGSFMDYVYRDAAVGWTRHGAQRSAGNVAQDQQVEKQLKKLDTQNLSDTQLRGVVDSKASTDIEKMAAAIKLAMKAGFTGDDRSRKQVGEVKGMMQG